MVWVYMARTSDNDDIAIEVYGTHAAACDRLKKEVESYFGKPMDQINDIPYSPDRPWETRYVSADYVNYVDGYNTYCWSVDAMEVINE